jgi:hypothetical protein
MGWNNPFNCTSPGNLFTGYEELIEEMLRGFRNGHSFALLGGRRCGKTSFLKQIQSTLKTQGLSPLTPLPVYLDMQGIGNITPATLFENMYRLIAGNDCSASMQWPEGREYEMFLRLLDDVRLKLDASHSADWVIILLVDELDSALEHLVNDQFFQNMRNLLMVSRYCTRFRMVATGVKEMASLISSGSSPLNNLRTKYLRVLNESEALELVRKCFPDDVTPEWQRELFRLTGRHPYLIQGLLEKIASATAMGTDITLLSRNAGEFMREHKDFVRWLDAFGSAEHAIYKCLAKGSETGEAISSIRKKLGASYVSQIDDACTVLSCHGVIDDSDSDMLRISSAMFRDWYLRNIPVSDSSSMRLQNNPVPVFISYSHKDEKHRESLESHLKLIQREGQISKWHDRKIAAGEEWKNAIDDNLHQARIILLLVSPEFIASDYCYDIELKEAMKLHEAGKAKVVPVIVRPCDWKKACFAKLQALPMDGKPVIEWQVRDKAWLDVAGGIRKIAEEIGAGEPL